MERASYTKEFKQQALLKVNGRGSRTIESVATEINVSLACLKAWMKKEGRLARQLPHGATALPESLPAGQWSAAQRLQGLLESHPLSGEARSSWCRQHGLFEHQLDAWRAAFCNPALGAALDGPARQARTELLDLKTKHESLKRDLLRKDRALSEAAALLVLQKKFQALWEDAA